LSDAGTGRRRPHFARATAREARRLASSAELERLVDLSVDMLGVATMSGRILVVNPAWSLTLGWAEEELRGRKALDFVHPDDRAHTLAEAARLAVPGTEIHDLELRMVHRDGSIRWLVWSARSDGARLYAVARDITRRKRIDAAAREAHELFRAAFEEAPIGMAVWSVERGRELRPVEVNRAMCEMLGRDADELLVTPPHELTHPDDAGIGRAEAIAMLRGETPSCSFEQRLVRGDGSVIWGQIRLSVARDAAGEPRYGIAQLQDVTARHEALEALRRSDQQLRTLVETAHEGIWVLDADDCTSFVNDRLAEMLGYSVEEMLGRPVYDFLAEHGRTLARARLASRREGVSNSQELRFIRKDGGEVWVILSGSPLADDAGNYAGTLDMLVDITGRKRREQALRSSEERYRNIVETTTEGVWMIDADHRTTYVNRRMAEMLGYTVEEMLGRPVADFAPAARRSYLETALASRRAGVSDQREAAYLRKDGSEMWALISGSPLTDGNGGYGGALAMVSDITERKRMEDDLSRLAAIVESSPDAILSTDLEGRINSWNSAAERLLGYSEEEAIGMQVWDLASPEARDKAAQVDGKLLAGGEIASFRTHGRHKDGTMVEVEPSLSAITAPDGEVVGALAIVRPAAKP
jgi:PAS domain S-box-containing protein